MTVAVIALSIVAGLAATAAGGLAVVVVVQRWAIERYRADEESQRRAGEAAERVMRAALSCDEPHPDPIPLDDVGVVLSDAVLDAWDEFYRHATSEDGWPDQPDAPTT